MEQYLNKGKNKCFKTSKKMYTDPELYYYDIPTTPRFSKRHFSKYYIINDDASDLSSNLSEENIYIDDTNKPPIKPKPILHKTENDKRSFHEKLSKPVLKFEELSRKQGTLLCNN